MNASQHTSLVTTPKPRVLVIDDEPDMLRMLSFVLTMEGFQITTVRSGEQALAAFDADAFDVVVTDLKMPGMDGFETLRAIKAVDSTVQIVVVTGFATPQTAALCEEAGAFEIVRKPFDLENLKTVLLDAFAAANTA